ncbi:MAG: polyprenol monophosphomannose synthase [Actinomycetota bacterium]
MLPVIVMPTYNEIENIEKIAREILALDCGAQLLIVDDNSPDGTGEAADRLASESEMVHVEHRAAKQGLGTAYKHGFQVALGMGADYIFEMDADFSHDPRYVPQMLSAIEQHDIVIGSRYVEGGGTRNWSIIRKFISRGASAYTRLLTRVKVHDTTSGFRCYRRDVLERIDFSRVSASGYGFQVEMTYVCEVMGFDIFELPIIFTDRRVGQSKMSKDIMWEAMWMVAGLKKKYGDLRPVGDGS